MADPTASSAPPPLGKLVRMRALKPSEIPIHPELGPQQVTAHSSWPPSSHHRSRSKAEGDRARRRMQSARFKSCRNVVCASEYP
ncbi:hypothetical protein KC325_g100 [Hortaea werneckii]|nr:hypothetical protein KC325_g100 [Hortaea werneckii]